MFSHSHFHIILPCTHLAVMIYLNNKPINSNVMFSRRVSALSAQCSILCESLLQSSILLYRLSTITSYKTRNVALRKHNHFHGTSRLNYARMISHPCFRYLVCGGRYALFMLLVDAVPVVESLQLDATRRLRSNRGCRLG